MPVANTNARGVKKNFYKTAEHHFSCNRSWEMKRWHALQIQHTGFLTEGLDITVDGNLYANLLILCPG